MDSLVKQEYRKVGVDAVDQTPEELLSKLARLPLQFSPGSVWEYGNSTDLLGHLLEKIAGKSLAELMAERIFKPLGMADSGFQVPKEKWERIAEPFRQDPFTRSPTPPALNIREPPKRFSGGAGAVATALDYYRFLQALLNGGSSQVSASSPARARSSSLEITLDPSISPPCSGEAPTSRAQGTVSP